MLIFLMRFFLTSYSLRQTNYVDLSLQSVRFAVGCVAWMLRSVSGHFFLSPPHGRECC